MLIQFEPHEDLAPLLYASCQPVLGRHRLLIYDLQRQTGLSLPGSFSSLFQLLETHRGESLARLRAQLPLEQQARLDALLRYLLEQELLFFTATPERFPPLSLAWSHPSPLLTVLLDVQDDSCHDLPALLAELDALQCERLSVRLKRRDPLDWLERFFVHWNPQGALTLDLQIHATIPLERTELLALIRQVPRIAKIQVLNSERTEVIQRPPSGFGILSEVHAALEFDAAMAPNHSELCFNQTLFCESQWYHTFAHRRICISARGALKNTVGAGVSFGQLGRDALAKVLGLPAFQAAWGLNKGRIEGCDTCEYRHACVDPRLPEANEEGVLRHTSLCHYDPALGTWRSSTSASSVDRRSYVADAVRTS